MIKEKLWCCVGYQFKTPCYNWQSLSNTRKISIEKHIDGGMWNWRKWKSKGWKCIRVTMTLEPIAS